MRLAAARQPAGRKGRDERMGEEPARTLDKAWNATCRVLFGKEIGGLGSYQGWLSQYLLPTAKRKSHLSGKEVIVAKDSYPSSARFISENELVTNRDYSLGINEIKDIDSIARAIGEKCEYTGNKVLGNSAFVGSSDIVIDSQFVENSTNIEESSYVDSSFMVRKGSKYVFGSGYLANSEFLVRVVGTINSRRCLESYFVPDSSDLYFCHNCYGCQNLMFSFGQRNTGYRIGNLQLSKENYQVLKAKLLEEFVAELEEKKRFPALFGLVPDAKPGKAGMGPVEAAKIGRMEPIEKGFAATCKVLFHKPVGGIAECEGWLSENTVRIRTLKSPFGAETCYPEKLSVFSEFPAGRRVGIYESVALGKLGVAPEDLGSLGKLVASLGKIGYFTSEFMSGENSNVIGSPVAYHGTNIYKTYDATHADNAGVCFLALNSKHVYGCGRILESQFSLKCYNSLYLNRCLELDSCSKCADSYFCHNCEGLQDAMFCFNMKGKRNVIGNTQLEKGKYAQLRDSLVAEMAGEIGKTKALKRNIYNIGADE